MVISMAAGIVKVVPPCKETEKVQKDFVRPFGLKDRPVT